MAQYRYDALMLQYYNAIISGYWDTTNYRGNVLKQLQTFIVLCLSSPRSRSENGPYNNTPSFYQMQDTTDQKFS